MSASVRFSHSQALDAEQHFVVFSAFSHGRMIPCAISARALMERFGADEPHLLDAFERHRGAIEKIAEALIEDHRESEDGAVVVYARDVAAPHAAAQGAAA